MRVAPFAVPAGRVRPPIPAGTSARLEGSGICWRVIVTLCSAAISPLRSSSTPGAEPLRMRHHAFCSSRPRAYSAPPPHHTQRRPPTEDAAPTPSQAAPAARVCGQVGPGPAHGRCTSVASRRRPRLEGGGLPACAAAARDVTLACSDPPSESTREREVRRHRAPGTLHVEAREVGSSLGQRVQVAGQLDGRMASASFPRPPAARRGPMGPVMA